MIRRPPRSTLFPTRRSSDLVPERRAGVARLAPPGGDGPPPGRPGPHGVRGGQMHGVALPGATHAMGSRARSEEHTSELQSRLHLVCRLLLEKKKKENNRETYSIVFSI